MFIIPILILLFSNLALAQMTLPSVFPDMKSVNPAVIELRRFGMYQLSAQQEKIQKKQKIYNLDETPFTAVGTDKIELNNMRLFKGGKGGGVTSEWILDYSQGEQETTVETGSEVTGYSLDANAYYGKYALGFSNRWGIEFHYLRYSSYTNYDIDTGGISSSEKIRQETTSPGVKIGKIIGSPALSLGLTFEYNSSTTKISGDTAESTSKTKGIPIVGVALGRGSPSGLLEIGVEAYTISEDKDSVTGEELPVPLKVSFIVERRFGPLILGYKGMLFRGNYMDIDKIIPTQLVYSTASKEQRLEHVFNFSFGSTHGLTIGGTIFYSHYKTDEKSNIFASENKHDTNVKSLGGGLRLGYVY